jgi:hypothetical protein
MVSSVYEGGDPLEVAVDTQDMANHALRELVRQTAQEFAAMRPMLESFARVVTKRPTLRVRLTWDKSWTDNQDIYVRPPLALGKAGSHQTNFCDQRTSYGESKCRRCAINDLVMSRMVHEISHVAHNTFEPAKDADIMSAIRRMISTGRVDQATGEKLREALMRSPDWMTVAAVSSPFLPAIVNIMEDVRVDLMMGKVRPGSARVRRADIIRRQESGGEMIEDEEGDKTWMPFTSQPLNTQLVVAFYNAVLDSLVPTAYSEPVVEAIENPTMQEFIRSLDGGMKTVRDAFHASQDFLTLAQELGFFPEQDSEDEDDEDGEPQPQPEPQDKGDDEPDDSAGPGEQTEIKFDDEPDDSSDENSDEDSGDNDGQEESDSDSDSDGGQSEGESEEESDGEDEESGSSGGAEQEDDEPNSDEGDDAEGGQGSDQSDECEDGDDADEGSGQGDSEEADEDSDSGGPGGTGEESEGEGEESDSSDGDGGSPQDGSEDGDDDSSSSATPDTGDGDGEEEAPDGGSGSGGTGSGESEGEGDSDGDSDGEASGESAGESSEESDDDASGSAEQGSGDDDDSPWGDDEDDYFDRENLDEKGDEPLDRQPQQIDPREYGTPEDLEKGFEQFAHQATASKDTVSPEQIKTLEEEMGTADSQIMAFDVVRRDVTGLLVSRPGQHALDANGRDAALAWTHDYEPYRSIAGYSNAQLGIEGAFEPSIADISRFIGAVRPIFDFNKRSSQVRNRKAGDIAGGMLARRVPFGDPRVFQRKQRPAKREYAVGMGIDLSASTTGINLLLLKQCALVMADAMNALPGVKFAVWGHSAQWQWRQWQGRGSRRQPVMTYDTKLVANMYECKPFNEPWSSRAREAVSTLGPDSENLDGHTLEFYRKEMQKIRATDKVFFYFTDGRMPQANYNEELDILTDNIELCKAAGIHLVGVGINTDSPSAYGLDTVVVSGPQDVHLVSEKLRERLLS